MFNDLQVGQFIGVKNDWGIETNYYRVLVVLAPGVYLFSSEGNASHAGRIMTAVELIDDKAFLVEDMAAIIAERTAKLLGGETPKAL